MPIQLTTAISVGDLEAGSLTHVKITRFAVDVQNGEIDLIVTFGRIVESAFVPTGVKRPDQFCIRGADYTSIVAATASAQGAILYDEVATNLYQWLIDNNHFAGTIV